MKSIQRRGARFVQKDYQRTSSVTAMMNELGWKPLAHRRREQRLTLLFKIIPATDHIVFNKRPSRSGHINKLKLLPPTLIYTRTHFSLEPLKIGIHYQKVK